MTRSVAFIRNVMVGRQGLTRDVLLDLFVDAGAAEPRSHLSTGNVSFDLVGPIGGLAAAVEVGIGRVTGHDEPLFVRSLSSLRADVDRGPFRSVPLDPIDERFVTFTRQRVGALDRPVFTARGDMVLFATRGRDLYCARQTVADRPTKSMHFLEAVVRPPFTTRSWRTIETIVAQHAGR